MEYCQKIREVLFHITYACEHQCPMCYANAGSCQKHPDLVKLLKITDRLVELGIESVTLVGGNPALYPGLEKLAEYMHEKGLDISILSNTLEISSGKASVLNSINVYEGTIHHSEAELHDTFCKCNGAYDRLINNLKYYSDAGKTVGIAVNIIPFNYNAIEQMIENIIDRGIQLDHVVGQRIVQFGRATGEGQYTLTHEMLHESLEQLDRVHKRLGIKILFEDPFPLCAVKKKFWKYIRPCSCGISRISLDFNGNISRCGADVFHPLGTIFDDNLLDIWSNHKALVTFREKTYLTDGCHNCKVFTQCGGGCPVSMNPEYGYSPDYLAKCALH